MASAVSENGEETGASCALRCVAEHVVQAAPRLRRLFVEVYDEDAISPQEAAEALMPLHVLRTLSHVHLLRSSANCPPLCNDLKEWSGACFATSFEVIVHDASRQSAGRYPYEWLVEDIVAICDTCCGLAAMSN
uniref:Uncharacterized protein n=2 Tax=Chrysotila carterae TaxID=13221 RepID=A0A7S4BEY1_CHRCT